MTTIARAWASYAKKLRFEDLDAATINSAKRFLYDSFGCALGATKKPDVTIAENVHRALGGVEQASLIGSGRKLPVTAAAFVNGLKIRAMDFNDIYWKADPVHPSDIISAPLAIAEWRGRSGAELIAAVVLAYELEMRLAECFEPGIREKGWHHATLTQAVSPLAAGCLMDLSEEQLTNAVGISGSHGCTLGKVVAGKLTNMKNTAEPFAVADGVIAALLAEGGYSGPDDVFEGKEGLFHCMGPTVHPQILTDGLGTEPFRINTCSMKAFPTEALTHTPISAFVTLIRDHHIAWDAIEAVHIRTIARAADILSDPAKYRPDSKETADHSLPYCIAAAAVDGSVTPGAFTEERLQDERIFAVIDRIKVVAEPEFEKIFPAKQAVHVTITTKSGASHELRMDYPKGDPRQPMTPEDLDIKFRSLAQNCMSDKRMDDLKAAIFAIDAAPRIDTLMQLLTADK